MKLIRGINNLIKESAITIGNFDGVHLGHKKIIEDLVVYSKKHQLKSVVISFNPTPQSFFGIKQATLTNVKEKFDLLKSLNVDYFVLISFNKRFSDIKADDFIKTLLNNFKMKALFVGDDFRFGKNKEGDVSFLKISSVQNNFQLNISTSLLNSQQRISSSYIRNLLNEGDFKHTQEILGREYSISGRVIHGEKKGRTIGFPTLNIPLKRKISPLFGVFAVEVVIQGERFKGVANIGKNPTLKGKKTLLEVFLFNFNSDVYQQQVQVFFKRYIRAEKKFNNLNELKSQIVKDCYLAKKILNHK
ncbi:Riboflavin kinase / FMN adenylyltransferase [hydrothermal vent metagenome]|uniref:Bifunctional riboflavin kinase/FMN adenylyltransferase n=1 Tax=hydrothermal vent metagenome TaxID=652676 RepID=A0A1W1CW89_9ZZZZ